MVSPPSYLLKPPPMEGPINFIFILFNLVRVCILVNFTDFFSFWILIELNMLSFLVLISSLDNVNLKIESFNQCLFYFMLQSFISLFFVMRVLCGPLLNFYLITIVFYTSLVFKLAIFPLHS